LTSKKKIENEGFERKFKFHELFKIKQIKIKKYKPNMKEKKSNNYFENI